MPGGDRTGPIGAGPRTGRAAGFCAGYGMPGFANPVLGRGRGLGYGRGYARGGGRGWRHRYWATGVPGWGRGRFGYGTQMGDAPPVDMPMEGDPQTELAELKDQSRHLQQTLDQIYQRIEELEKNTGA
jgi:hypothetical protein